MTDDEALDMIAKGHAALVANRKPVVEPPVVIPPRPPEPVKEVTVALGGLAKAIAGAEPGVRVVVSETTSASFALRDVAGPATGVTVDLSKVKIGNLQVAGVANVEFLGLDLNIAQVRNSKAIRFTRANVHDSSTSGLGFYSCQGVVVTASTFTNLRNGIAHDHCDDVTVSGNRFTGMTSDGVTGVGVVRLQVLDNDFHDFNPSPGAHPDAVQLFTTNAKRSATDIIVRGNRIRRGAGGITQGVFITTNTGFEAFRYARVEIADNLIEGGMYNGIMASGVDDLTIARNTVQPYTDQKSWIRIANCSGVRMDGNAYAQLLLEGVSGLDRRDKETLTAIAPR